jgi:hypothetical protein
MSGQDYSTTPASNTGIDGIDVDENCAFSGLNNAIRSLMADFAQYADDVGGAAVSTGTDTIALTTAQTITAYADGLHLVFIAGGTNTGATTLNVDTVGEKAIVKGDGAATELAAGDIVAGMPVVVLYDASVGAGSFLLVNPTSGNGTTAFLNGTQENQAVTGGATVTPKDLGTATTGTTTLDVGDCPLQDLINGGAFTLAPGTVYGACILTILNNGSAGAITTSGFTIVAGDDFDTTDTNKFRCHVCVQADGSSLIVTAMQ